MSPSFQLFSSLRYDPLLNNVAANIEGWAGTKTTEDSPFYMLPFHRDRLLQAAEEFGWTKAANAIRGPQGFETFLQRLTEAIDVTSPNPLKVKTLLNHDGTIEIESSEIPARTENRLFPKRIPPPRDANQLKVSPLTGGALTLGDGDSVSGDPPTDEAWIIIPDTAKTVPSPYTSFKTTSRDMYALARERVGIEGFADKKEVLIVSVRDGEIMEGSLTSLFFWREGRWVTPPVSSGGQVGTTRRWALQKGLCVEGVVKVDSLVDGEECWISNGVRGFQFGRVKLA